MDATVETPEVRLGILSERPAATPDLPMSAERLQELRLIQLSTEQTSRMTGIDDAKSMLRLPEEVLHRAVAVDDASRLDEVHREFELTPDATDVCDVLLDSSLRLIHSVRPDLLAELTMKKREVGKMKSRSELIRATVLPL